MADLTTQFNTDELLALLRSFYTLTQLKVVVFDPEYREVAAYPEADSAFCTYIKSTEAFYGKCDACVRYFCDSCKAQKDLFVNGCHAGLTEAVFPITDSQETILGYIMFGQTSELPSHRALFRHVAETCGGKLALSEELRRTLREIRLRSIDEIVSASEILKTLAGYIAMKQFIVKKTNYLILDIHAYIEEHIGEPISVKDICRKLYISKTTLYRILKKEKYENISQLITDRRIALAEKLLSTTGLSVSEVARQTGFANASYFSKVFRKKTGSLPREYRKQLRP